MNSNSQPTNLTTFESFDLSAQKTHQIIGGRRNKRKKKKQQEEDKHYEIISDGAFF